MPGIDDLLVGVALKYTPDLIGSVFGEKSGQTARDLVETIKTLTGKETADEAMAVFKDNPELQAKLQEKAMDLKKAAEERAFQERMAERQTMFAEFQERMKDIGSARQHTLELHKAGSVIAWGAPIVSVIVLTTFLLTLYLAFTSEGLPNNNAHDQLINLMAGALTTMATAVVGYWVGTSASSAQKTNLLAMSSPVSQGGSPTALKK